MRLIHVIIFIIFIPFSLKSQTITAAPESGCDTLTVRFTYIPETPVVPVTSYLWNFGNGTTSLDSLPPDSIFYSTPGRYNVFLVLNGTDTTNIITIQVGNPPPTNFAVNGDPNILESSFTVSLTPVDTTYGGRTYEWRINGSSLSTYPEYLYTFPAAGSYEVMLLVGDSLCPPRATRKTISVSDILEIPNVFCPNCDEYNRFTIQSNGLDPITIHIYNRTGNLVYKSTSPVISWDGRSSSNQILQTGVYYYVVEYDVQPKPQTVTGFVHLFLNK
ncbi:MAG: gliding motility-associated C-terminal domain-containing protein [Bacteroidales bacterium]|nr:gliding motility-associated C-terminal domain-containing protein [Bacteroidales bacterium]